jgi:hypothetical protein
MGRDLSRIILKKRKRVASFLKVQIENCELILYVQKISVLGIHGVYLSFIENLL